jgi:hypothetical protein
MSDSENEVLIKLTLYPCRNYDGADMIDYKIVTLKTANILTLFREKNKNLGIGFYCGFDGCTNLKNMKIYTYKDNQIINAYKLLKTSGIIGENHVYDGSYYVYNLLVEALMSYDIDDYDGEYDSDVSETDIWEKWNTINSIEDI